MSRSGVDGSGTPPSAHVARRCRVRKWGIPFETSRSFFRGKENLRRRRVKIVVKVSLNFGRVRPENAGFFGRRWGDLYRRVL